MNRIKILTLGVITFLSPLVFADVTSNNWWDNSASSTNYYIATTTSPTVTTQSQISSPYSLPLSEDSNSNFIRDDVDSVMGGLTSQYQFNAAQKSSLEQIARSYQYVLSIAPNTSSDAYNASLRDVASTNCATSRIPPNLMDLVVSRIESVSLNTTERQNIYNRYISLLSESEAGASTNVVCEDQYSSSNTNSNANTNTGSVISGAKANLPCLVLTRFMEFGSSGEQVTKLGTFLAVSGYMSVWPTGYFGPNTTQSVKDFQNKYGIDSRYGWVGPSTRAKIAEITCGGDPNAIAAAKKGYVGSSVIIPNTSSTNTNSNSSSNSTTVNIPKTTTTIQSPITTTPQTPVYTSTAETLLLSSSSGTFDLSQNPVNSLYFTVKTNTQSEGLYVCMEKTGAYTCQSSSGYNLVSSKYDPTNFDSIANNDRWIFNVYYNSNIWGETGGKIYFKKGINGIVNTYNVLVKTS